MVNKNMAKGQRLKAATKKKALKATSEVCFTNFWGSNSSTEMLLFLPHLWFFFHFRASTHCSLSRTFSAVAVQFEL